MGQPPPAMGAQIGFASNPLDSPQVWTDITSLVRSAKTRRGRQHVLNAVEPGTLDMVCDGRGRELDPTNTSGPYAPNVDINKQVQLGPILNALTYAQSLCLSGWTAGVNTTLASAAFAGHTPTTNAITLTAVGAGTVSTVTPTGFKVVGGRSYVVMLGAGGDSVARTVQMTIVWYDRTGATISSSTPYNATEAGSFTILNSVTVTAPATAVTAQLTVTYLACLAGETHRFAYPGLLDAAFQTATAAFVQGGPIPIITAFLDAAKPQWLSNLGTDIALSATDTLRMLRQTSLPADPLVTRMVLDGATAIWPMDDPAGTTTAREVVAGRTATPAGLTFGSAPRAAVVTTSTAAVTGGVPQLACPVAAGIAGTGAFAIEAVFNISSSIGTGALAQLYWQQGAAQFSSNYIDLHLSTSGVGPVMGNIVFVTGTTGGSVTVTSGTNYADGNWHHVLAGRDGTGATFLYVDGVGTFGTGAGANIDTPTLVQWLQFVPVPSFENLPGSVSALAIYGNGLSGDRTALAQRHYQAAFQYFSTPQVSTARFADSLLLAGFPSAYYAAAGAGSDAGNSSIAAASSPMESTPALTYAQTVALAEDGLVFARVDGVVALFDRHHWVNVPTPTVVFGDNPAAGEIPYKPSPDFGLDNIDLYNRSTASSSVTGNTQVAQSTASQTKYGTVSSLDEGGLEITSDAEALARVQWNVARYAVPLPRLRSIVIDVLANAGTALLQYLFQNVPNQAIEIGQEVIVNRRPWSRSAGFSGAVFSQVSLIEGIEHDIDVKGPKWLMTLHLSPVDTQGYWVLGTGALGSGTRLAY